MHRRDLLKLSMLLLGTSATASVSRALHAGVGNIPGTSSSAFNDGQRLAVNLLADMIIPPSDTPGAVDAGVPAFIEAIVADWYTETERTLFLQGLEDLDSYCLAHGNIPFIGTSEEIRIAALRDQEAIASEYKAPASAVLSFIPEDDQQAPFFKKIKELVVLGYYTSKVGATQELVYQPMTHHFDGDYDFAKVGRQWSH